jgi:hypothetical protein
MMRRHFRLACGVLCTLLSSSSAFAAEPGKPSPPSNGITVGHSQKNDVSPPLREIPVKPLELQPQHLQREPLAEISHEQEAPDPVVQRSLAPAAMPAPTLNFDGIGFPGVACNCAPPDTNGEVGATQYVQMVNEGIEVFDKTTGASVYGPVSIATLWSGFGGLCQTSGNGDPVVLYDQLADRWVVSQFAGTSAITEECIAVSTTSDATGAWYRYDFHLGSNFFDYPKLSVWPDAYYLAENVFNASGTAYLGPQPFALDRAAMLAGNPATFITPGLQSASLGFMLSADLDGSNPPPAGAPNPWLSTEGAAWSVYRFHVDWGTPANSTFLLGGSPSPAGFTTLCPVTRGCVPQLGGTGTADRLDGIGDRPMFRLAYRHFLDGHEALVGNLSVDASGVAGVRWWEINNATSGAPGFVQQGTYAPDTTWRWMGSIAMDTQGNLAVGFSASSASIHPEIRYAGRLAGDPAGVLAQGEATLFAGTGSQTGTSNRWGDYSDLTVDPVDDCTFWYTQEYYATTGGFNWRTRVGNFKFPGCAIGPTGTLKGQVTVCGSGLPIAGALVSTGVASTTTDGGGNYSLMLPPGDYTVAVSAPGYAAGGGPATVTDGGTTVLDVCLSGVPLVGGASAALTAENCSPGDGVPDPGETVTVSLCLRNTGGAAAGNVVATLEATGGVVSPSGPQSYGALANDGIPVCRDFVFTVDPITSCGGTVTATLDLQDGATNLGTAAYPFTSGVPVIPFSEDFDGVVAPALPAGWTASNAAGGGALWTTSTVTPDTAPNDAFVDDPAAISDKRLDSPGIPITSTGAQLTFRNSFNLESTYDGGVLEISMGGGAFADILAAGGSFLSGGYNGTIDNRFGNPLANRQAWTGDSGGYSTTVATLPPAAAGQSVVLRFRMGSDSSVTNPGWRVDTISLTDGFTCCGTIPSSLQVDAHPTAAPTALGLNKVFEPGETVVVEPGYFNGMSNPLVVALTGAASNFTGPAGAVYTLGDGTADYGLIGAHASANCFDATGNCYQVSVDNPSTRPAAHWDSTFDELLSNAATKTWTLHIGDSFTDTPNSNIFYSFIETIFHKGITGGCGAGVYCPGNSVTRAQMAVFILKAEHGAAYVPPACTGIFTDVECVPTPAFAVDWIEQLFNEGITGGCGAGIYCSGNNVTRAQMAVFLLKGRSGASYTPAACTGIFTDVECTPTPAFAVDWIEQLYNDGITGGCGVGIYCPNSPVTRGQMAVFLTKTFGLLLYGP